MHIHQELHQFLARDFLRAFRHLVELRDQFAELPNLILKYAAGLPRASFGMRIGCEPGFPALIRVHGRSGSHVP